MKEHKGKVVSGLIIAAAVFCAILGTNFIVPNHAAVERENGKTGPDWTFALVAAGLVLVVFIIVGAIDKKRASIGKTTTGFTPFN